MFYSQLYINFYSKQISQSSFFSSVYIYLLVLFSIIYKFLYQAPVIVCFHQPIIFITSAYQYLIFKSMYILIKSIQVSCFLVQCLQYLIIKGMLLHLTIINHCKQVSLSLSMFMSNSIITQNYNNLRLYHSSHSYPSL